jgi:hypothetical protein
MPWLEADKAALEKIQQRAIAMVSGMQGNYMKKSCENLA